MITSQRQLIAAKEKIKMLKESLLAEYKKDVPEILKVAATGQIEELISEIEEYEFMKKQ